MMAIPVSQTERTCRQAKFFDADDLQATLAQASALANQADARAIVLALDELGDIELPDTTPSSAEDQAQIRAIAPLYLAAQLEEAGLLSAVETMSGLAVSGAVQIDLGPAAALIQNFWQHRNERFHENERRAIFARLFGMDPSSGVTISPDSRSIGNRAFEDLMIDFAEALYKLDENSIGGNYGGPHAQTRLTFAARNLTENLLYKGGGMTAFTAKELLNTVQEAVKVLQQPAVQHAFGSRSLWSVVRAISRRYHQVDRETSIYVTRGKSGLVLLSWLADSLPQLGNGQPLTTMDHPVVGAATEWLQASLAIREAGSQRGG